MSANTKQAFLRHYCGGCYTTWVDADGSTPAGGGEPQDQIWPLTHTNVGTAPLVWGHY